MGWAAVENTCVLGREKLALRVGRGDLASSHLPVFAKWRECNGSHYTEKEIGQLRGRARTWSLLESTTWPLGLGVCGFAGTRLTCGLRVRPPGRACLTLEWRASGGVVRGLLPCIFIRSPSLPVRGWIVRVGLAPLVAYPKYLLCPDWSKPGNSVRDLGGRAVGPFLSFQSSESWARTHRAPAQALSRSGSSRYSPPALPWAPPPSDLNQPPLATWPEGASYASACSLPPPSPVDRKRYRYWYIVLL